MQFCYDFQRNLRRRLANTKNLTLVLVVVLLWFVVVAVLAVVLAVRV